MTAVLAPGFTCTVEPSEEVVNDQNGGQQSIWPSISKWLPGGSRDTNYWWQLTGCHLATMMTEAGYSGIHVPNGSVVRLIDFAPGVESPFHRAMSIDYGIVVEGVFELTLDSGESRIMHPGDMSVNCGAMHKWRNVCSGRNGRILFVLLDVQPLIVNGEEIKEDLGDLSGEYADLHTESTK